MANPGYTYAGAGGAGLQVVFKAIVPRSWSLKHVIPEMLAELDHIAFQTFQKFRDVTDTWTEVVLFTFARRVYPGAQTASIKITTDNLIFGLVNGGVEAHSIEPREPMSKRNPAYPSALSARAQGSYRAKTSPGRLSSGPGGPSGPIIYRPGVWHPGYPGRNFVEQIAEWSEGQMDLKLPQAIERGVDKGMIQ